MGQVRIQARLPYHLLVPEGEYEAASGGQILFLASRADPAREGAPGVLSTVAHGFFDCEEGIGDEQAEKVAQKQAHRLFGGINHLLRWYRLLARRPEAREVSKAQLSPFIFTRADTRGPWVVPSVEYEQERPPEGPRISIADMGQLLRSRLRCGTDPDLGKLTLLDAEHAETTGRFREAVLLSWSVIDFSFSRKFDSLVDERLSAEWSDARTFLKGIDFGLRYKMTAGLRLLCGRSLFGETDLWSDLSASYRKRNDIIHKNHGADAGDARKAIDVARRVVAFLEGL